MPLTMRRKAALDRQPRHQMVLLDVVAPEPAPPQPRGPEQLHWPAPPCLCRESRSDRNSGMTIDRLESSFGGFLLHRPLWSYTCQSTWMNDILARAA